MSKTKPHILERDKRRFECFLKWASPYTPYTPIPKLRKAFAGYKLQNRWIEFTYHLVGDTLSGKHIDKIVLVQGVLTGELYRRNVPDFYILLRKVHFDGKPVIDALEINKRNRLQFSARTIYDCRPKG
jgi:hypothetical protein